jgi:hypothetical protein
VEKPGALSGQSSSPSGDGDILAGETSSEKINILTSMLGSLLL